MGGDISQGAALSEVRLGASFYNKQASAEETTNRLTESAAVLRFLVRDNARIEHPLEKLSRQFNGGSYDDARPEPLTEPTLTLGSIGVARFWVRQRFSHRAI